MVSAIPVSFKYSVARRATLRGYWSKGRFWGRSMTMTSPIILSVGMAANWSMVALSRSGTNTMSLLSTGA